MTKEVTLADPEDSLSITSSLYTWTVNSEIWTQAYDAASASHTTTTPTGRQIVQTSDNKGQLTSVQEYGGETLFLTRDALGRPELIRQGQGVDERLFQIGYDSHGFLDRLTQTVDDQTTLVTTLTNDLAGRVKQVAYNDGRIVSLDYDKMSRVSSITPPGKLAHTFEYWPTGKLHRYTPPDVGIGPTSTEYNYDLDQKLTTITRPDGKFLTIGYDSAGRRSTITTPRGIFTATYSPTTGNLASLTTPEQNSITQGYDGALLQSETWSGDISGAVERTFNSDFKLASITVAGVATTIGYDKDRLLTQSGDLAITHEQETGLVASHTLGNLITENSYTLFKELQTTTTSVGNTQLYNAVYAYNKLGQITLKTETIGAVTTAYTYEYDGANYLQNVLEDGSLVSSYSYDANGNRQTVSTLAQPVAAVHDAQDRLLSQGDINYSYTANGELQSRTIGTQTTTYHYDVFGNLTQVVLADGTVIDYVIDGRHRRIGKKVNGQQTQGLLYLDQLNPVAELDGSNTVVSRFIYGDKPNVPAYMVKIDPVTQQETTYRIISDHLGSVRLVVNVDTDAIAQRMDYDDWGDVIQDTNSGFQPFGFAGGLYDQYTHLTRFGARDYDAGAGRWTAKDPIRFKGEDPNLYSYVFNFPLNFIDIEGLLGCPATVSGCRNNALYWYRYPKPSGEKYLHCGDECYNERTDNRPINQCCYKADGSLSTGLCEGTPDFNTCDNGGLTVDCMQHIFTDPGGVLRSGPSGLWGSLFGD